MEPFDTTMYLAIGVATVGIGFILNLYRTIHQYNQKLEHVRKVISDDFYQVYIDITDKMATLETILKNKEVFDDHCLGIYYGMKDRGDLHTDYDFSDTHFLLFESIITSGGLILLQPHEIQLIHASQNYIRSGITVIGEDFKKYALNFKENYEEYFRGRTKGFRK